MSKDLRSAESRSGQWQRNKRAMSENPVGRPAPASGLVTHLHHLHHALLVVSSCGNGA
jgi:hypothetical protein